MPVSCTQTEVDLNFEANEALIASGIHVHRRKATI